MRRHQQSRIFSTQKVPSVPETCSNMSTPCTKYLTKKQRLDLLMNGYISKNYNHNVPLAIIRLCQSFYDEYLYWTIKGNDMIKFKNCIKMGEFILSPKIYKYDEYEFQCKLFPRGSLMESSDKCSIFMIEALNIPSDVQSITLGVELNFESEYGYSNKETLHCSVNAKPNYVAAEEWDLSHKWLSRECELNFNYSIVITKITKKIKRKRFEISWGSKPIV